MRGWLIDIIPFVAISLASLFLANTIVSDRWGHWKKLIFHVVVGGGIFVAMGIYWLVHGENLAERALILVFCDARPQWKVCSNDLAARLAVEAQTPSQPAHQASEVETQAEAERQKLARLQKQQAETKREAEDKATEAAARKKADEQAKTEAERQRIAQLQKQEAEKKRANEDQAHADSARKKAEHEDESNAERQRLALLQEDAAEKKSVPTNQTALAKGFRDCPKCPEMVAVPAGSFNMGSLTKDGSSTEHPQHVVTIAAAFAVGKHEVNVAEYSACVAAGACKPPLWKKPRRPYHIKADKDDPYKILGTKVTGDNYPIVGVDWRDAKEYVTWLSRKTGKQYRLLSEAEWEYAARGVTRPSTPNTAYSWGNSIECSTAAFNGGEGSSCYYKNGSNHLGEKLRGPQPVGSYAPNAFGIYDMHGNVAEWVEDCWHDNYDGAPSDGSAWTSKCQDSAFVVYRGGSWVGDPYNLRSAYRNFTLLSEGVYVIGFRVARSL